MALDKRYIRQFKALCAGQGQPDEREFAAALLTLDRAVDDLSAKVARQRDYTLKAGKSLPTVPAAKEEHNAQSI